MNSEPIAIVGIACRFPGDVSSPEDLLALLRSKRSGIVDVPSDRWDRNAFYHPDFRKPGHIHARRGGFLSRVAEFDAAFFGISPNEAKRMDPQQRLILEVAFGAIEDAGMRLEQLAGRSISVMVGAGLSDYGGLTSAHTERQNVGGASNPGSALSIVSNRVSYMFDFRGPSFTVDTACSSSLTAMHLACRTIWDGTAEAALVGGASVILKPEITLGFSKGGYLSPDGESRAFSDDANGYVRSEGVAIALLKPLARAVADGDRIYAVVRSTWINQDGRTSGMTVPSQSAQEALIRTAFEGAGVDPARACYIEAHGTGTPAGDPVEATGIGSIVGQARGRTEPCYIGSVKTNLGHMEFAAGMGGLVKLALVLQRREILPSIHFRRPNPKIDFNALGLRMATECMPLPQEGSLFGGVNSFGFGGANAHVVLESPPRAGARRAAVEPPRATVDPAPSTANPNVFVLSARSASALRTLAGCLAEQVRKDTTALDDLAAALMHRRSRFEFRLALVCRERQELANALAEFAGTGDPTSDLFVGRAREGRTEKVAFVFTGQGAQWYAMGRSLLTSNRTFQDVVERIEVELQRLGWLADERGTLRAELNRDAATSRIGRTEIAQPCLFALQVGLAEVLAQYGITPAAVVGHSIGELAAAVVSQALSLEEATRIVYWRSRSQAMAEGKGAMASLGVTEQEARDLVAQHPGQVEIAAVNGPSSITIAGSHGAVDAIVSELERKQTFCRRLDISVPFHCYLMDPIETAFKSGLGAITSRPAEVPFYSTVSGEAHEGALDLEYWYANIRQPVRYADALRAMSNSGVACFVEVGPHPALMHGSVDLLRQTRATYLPTLRRSGDDAVEIARMRAMLFVAGGPCEPLGTRPAPFMELPRHPFERHRFWLETEAGREERMLPIARIHPHIGRVERSAQAKDVVFCELLLDPRVDTYLAEHVGQGHIVFPAAGQAEVVTAAARHVYGTADVVLENVEFKRPMVLPSSEDETATFRLEIYSDDGHFVIASRVGGGSPVGDAGGQAVGDAWWMEHTRGCIRRSESPQGPRFDLDELRKRMDIEMSTPGRYRAFSKAGLELGPTFRCIVRSYRDETRLEQLAELEPRPSMAVDRGRFLIHPALLDATIQAGMPIDSERGDSQQLCLPSGIGEFRFFGPVPEGRIWAYVHHQPSTREEKLANVDVMDDQGAVFLRFRPLIVRPVHGPTARFGSGLVYEHEWRPRERSVDRAASAATPRAALAGGAWLLLAGTSDTAVELGRSVERELRRAGRRLIRALAAPAFRQLEADLFEVRPDSPDDFAKLVSMVEPIAGVVHGWSCDLEPASASAHDGVRTGAIAMRHVLEAVTDARAWAPGKCEVWLVTAGATTVVAEDRQICLGAATTLGFGRVLMSERPRLVTTLVDVAAGGTPSDLEELARELVAGPSDPEVAFRGGRRFVRTMTPSAELKLPRRMFDVKTDALRAVVQLPGVLDSVALEQFYPHELLPDEVEVSVRAVGLNFRDVAAAMNLLPKRALEGGFIGPHELGSDSAGIVTAIGADVTNVRPGDRVFGFFSNCLATRVIGKASRIEKIADGFSFDEVAALPIPFITVETALDDLARLQRGETILVHAAAGGVGCIAVQMALHRGAKVIATTSTDDKRAFLRGLGVEHIFNSRTANFGDEVLALTHGRGVDVVLNSLSGPAVTESLRCLRAFGRFVEIGKTDVYRNRQVGLMSLADNKSYVCLDANRLVDSHARAGVLRRAMEARASGAITTIPTRRFPFDESAAALRCLAQGKQIGKIIVDVPTEGLLEADPSTELRLDRSAVYLVTGGCAGFGLAVAEWLTTKGARTLILAGRRGLVGDDERAKVEVLSQRGVRVEVRNADVSVREEVERLVEEAKSFGRLAGVFHAAAVLDDAPIAALDEARYDRVLAAKADGALHLHTATAGVPLDYFVLFSSIAAVVGTPGQANYAAANAFLDELAAWRKTVGLPATSINWGAIDDVGMVARAAPERRRKILGQGVAGLPSDRALAVLERLLLEGSTRRVVADLHVARLSQLEGARRRFPSLFGQASAEAHGTGESLRAQILQAPEDARAALLTEALATTISGVAGLGDQKIDVDASLGRYGFDSLMTAQLQTWIEEHLGVSVAMVHLMRGPTTRELAIELVAQCTQTAQQGGLADTAMLVPLSPVEGTRFALICFPPMGMGSEVFAFLQASLPKEVALYGLESPSLTGPSAALYEGPIEEQHAAMAAAIDAVGSVPFAFYGHSMGAYIAAQVAASLRTLDRRGPAFMALAAVPLPEWASALAPEGIESPADITGEMVEAALVQMRGDGGDGEPTPRAVLERVRRDLWVTVRGRSEARISMSVAIEDSPVLLGASEDSITTLDKLPPDELLKLGFREVVRVPGSHHFFLEDAGREAVGNVLSNHIAGALGGERRKVVS